MNPDISNVIFVKCEKCGEEVHIHARQWARQGWVCPGCNDFNEPPEREFIEEEP
jgi:formylmethanofuran dehydrogenase subunit E